MYGTLAAVGREPLPPIRGHPALAQGPAAAAAVYGRLADLYEAWLQPGRARRLRESTGGRR